jgi:hypothetical protein
MPFAGEGLFLIGRSRVTKILAAKSLASALNSAQNDGKTFLANL